jgi:site-specific recombinase XerC
LASIHRHPNSRYWYCCINIPGRGQLQRTTKQTDRRKAYDFAQKLEQASRANVLTEIQARKILAEIYEIRNPGERLPGSTIKDFFESWANNKGCETARSTGTHYKRTALRFIAWLGEKSERDITALAPRDILAFRNELASRLSASTANHAIKTIRMALKDAQAASLVTANVASGIRPPKSPEYDGARHKRPFTVGEIKRLLRIADDEWRGLILFGLYTGQRLGDIASLTWQNIDLARGELGLVTRKTKRRVLVPLAAPNHSSSDIYPLIPGKTPPPRNDFGQSSGDEADEPDSRCTQRRLTKRWSPTASRRTIQRHLNPTRLSAAKRVLARGGSSWSR